MKVRGKKTDPNRIHNESPDTKLKNLDKHLEKILAQEK